MGESTVTVAAISRQGFKGAHKVGRFFPDRPTVCKIVAVESKHPREITSDQLRQIKLCPMFVVVDGGEYIDEPVEVSLSDRISQLEERMVRLQQENAQLRAEMADRAADAPNKRRA